MVAWKTRIQYAFYGEVFRSRARERVRSIEVPSLLDTDAKRRIDIERDILVGNRGSHGAANGRQMEAQLAFLQVQDFFPGIERDMYTERDYSPVSRGAGPIVNHLWERCDGNRFCDDAVEACAGGGVRGDRVPEPDVERGAAVWEVAGRAARGVGKGAAAVAA